MAHIVDNHSARSNGFFLLVLATIALLSASLAPAQETADFFQKNCANCHTIGGDRLTGPDLKNVTQRKDREWLIQFMLNPRAVIESGDPYARKILEESRNVPMPSLPGLTRQRAEYLLDLIEAESQLPESRFKGLKISMDSFTEADRQLGRELFIGRTRLERGGASCLSCHTTYDIRTLGGGNLGPDLTRVFERLKGRKSLTAWLMSPATETMQPVFKKHPLTLGEVHALVAYLEETAGQTPQETSAGRITFLVLGLLLATAIVFGLDAIWNRRFHSVRRPLVDNHLHGRGN